MVNTSRQLRKSKTLSAAEVAKRTIVQSGLSPSAMSRWAALNIIRLLNGKPSSVTERVTWIVEACQQVIQVHEFMKLPHTSQLVAPTPDKEALLADTGRILKELNARLAKYKCLPVVRYLASPSRCFDVRFEFLASAEAAASECVAISWLMDHIHAVHRIRRCRLAECGKWYFAVTDHQKYCGDRCRKRDAQQGPEFKRKRAEYMREKYRPHQKELDARAKRLARGKSK
jgi:hypothetical protein